MPMIRRHVAGPNRGPYRLKGRPSQRPIVLTQVLVGQPNNDLLNKGPLESETRSGPLIVCPIFGPIYGPKPDLAR